MAETNVNKRTPFKKKLNKLLGIDLMGRKNMMGYIFVIPFVIGFVLIFAPSIIQSFRFSLSTLKMEPDGYNLIFEGLGNYKKAFLEDPDYRKVLLETLRDIVINLPVILIFSFFMAILLNRKNFPGRTIIRIIFFLPVIIYSGVASTAGMTAGLSDDTAAVAAQIFSDPTLNDTGLQTGAASIMSSAMNLQAILSSLNLGPGLMSFITLSVSRLEWIIQSSGVQILIFLAALQTIPTAIFEAAQVEGLTTWEMFWKITLPMISPMILVNAVYTIVDSFTNSRYQVQSFIHNVSFGRIDYGYGSALAFIYFICTIIIIGVVALIVSRYVFYND